MGKYKITFNYTSVNNGKVYCFHDWVYAANEAEAKDLFMRSQLYPERISDVYVESLDSSLQGTQLDGQST